MGDAAASEGAGAHEMRPGAVLDGRLAETQDVVQILDAGFQHVVFS